MNIAWKHYLMVLLMVSLLDAGVGSDVKSKLVTTGVLDRIEDGDQAVILVEEWQEELVIPLEKLPGVSETDTLILVVPSWFLSGIIE